MKILLVSHGSGPYGAERVLLGIARGLIAREHEVLLDLPHPGPALDAAHGIAGLQVRLSQRPRLPRNGAEALRYLLAAPAAVRAIRRAVRETRPDVTWVNSMYNPWGALGARLAGAPVVWHLHERTLPRPIGWLVGILIGVAASRAVVVSDYIAEGFRRFPWLRRRVRVIRNPLLHELAPLPPPPAAPFTVGYVGQLEPRKRAPDLARALEHLPGLRAVFIGDGKARHALEQAVEDSGVSSRVEVLGYREDVTAALRGCHCVAIPSLREPFGLVALEAMARGLPVVAANSGALPEVLADAALYHRPGDPVDLARQIRRLREEPDLRRELREKGLRRVTTFRPDGWLNAIEAVLEDVRLPEGNL